MRRLAAIFLALALHPVPAFADITGKPRVIDGAAVWRRIVKVIEELQREGPGPGERWH